MFTYNPRTTQARLTVRRLDIVHVAVPVTTVISRLSKGSQRTPQSACEQPLIQIDTQRQIGRPYNTYRINCETTLTLCRDNRRRMESTQAQ